MMIVQGSAACRFFLWLWQGLRSLWHKSALGGWFHRRRLELQTAGQDSRVCQFVARQGAVARSWDESWVNRLVTAVWNLPVTVAKGVYRLGRKLWDGSLCFKGLTAVGRASGLLLGLFALVMLVAPHEKWDNLYAFLGAAAVFCFFALGCSDQKGKALEVGRLGAWFTLYLVFITLGLVLSLSVSLSLRFYIFHLTCFLIALVAVSAVDSYQQLRALLICGAVGVAVAALYGCYQGYVGVEVVASQQDLVLNEGMPGRIYSFFDNPNNFAEVLVMLVPLTGALTLNAKGWRGRLGGLVALGLGLVALGMTYSRSSWLGLVLAVAIFLALMDWRFVPAMVVVGLCAIPFLPESILNRILTIGNMEDSSARYRIAIYENTSWLLRDYGVTGVGLGSDVMGKVFRHYPTLYDGNYPIHAHNNYLQMWGEVGIFGLLAFLALVLGQIKEGLRAFYHANKELRRVIAAALGSFVGILAVGLVEYTWFYPRNMFLFWFLFGVIASCVKLASQSSCPEGRKKV